MLKAVRDLLVKSASDQSPCTQVCQPYGDLCVGCFRTLKEITEWGILVWKAEKEYLKILIQGVNAQDAENLISVQLNLVNPLVLVGVFESQEK